MPIFLFILAFLFLAADIGFKIAGMALGVVFYTLLAAAAVSLIGGLFFHKKG